MKKLFRLVSGMLTMMLLAPLHAENLVDIYKEALVNDPTFKKAQADWLTARQNFPLALTGNGAAGSGVFPNVTFSGTAAKDYQQVSSIFGRGSGTFDANEYAINVTQPVFNLATWLSISSARYSVKAATATYLAAAQDLMIRVETAYFEVLRANDRLNLTLAQQNQFKYQLDTAEQKFKVGLIAITGVYDAQASYDRSVADEIRDRNELQDRLEDLRAITGRHYDALAELSPVIPLVVPTPNNISKWVEVSLRQNYIIQSDLNNMFTARENVKVAAVGNMPTINFTASYSDGTTGGLSSLPAPTVLPHTRTQQTLVGGSLNFPVLQGGYTIVNTKQASYQYLSASDQLQLDYRTVENRTRQAYLGIQSGISQIQADQQAILSSRNQLEATKAGYIVGTRTMVDVLDSVTSLTQTQLAYADDRYNYVEGIFTLKNQAGTLSPEDIKRINSWLGKNLHFSLKQPEVKVRTGIKKILPKVQSELLQINKPELTNPVPGKGMEEAVPPPSPDRTETHDEFYRSDVVREDKMLAPYVKEHPPMPAAPHSSPLPSSLPPLAPKKSSPNFNFQQLPKPGGKTKVAPSTTKTLPEPKTTDKDTLELMPLPSRHDDIIPSLSTDIHLKKDKNHLPSSRHEEVIPSLSTDADLKKHKNHPTDQDVIPSLTTNPDLKKSAPVATDQPIKPSMTTDPDLKEPATDLEDLLIPPQTTKAPK